MTEGSASIAPSRILVVAWGILGDSVCKLPAIAAIRARFPDAALTVWAEANVREVFDGQPFIDRLWIVRGRKRGLKGWPAAAVQLWQIRRGGFDLVVNLHAGRHTARMTAFSGARYRTGRNRPGVAWPYNLVPAPELEVFERCPLPELNSHVARFLGAAVEQPYLPLVLSPENRREAASILKGLGWQEGRSLVLLNPAASKAGKTWPAASMGELGLRLAAEGARVLALRNPGFETLQAEVVEAGNQAIGAVPPVRIKTLCAILECASLVVTGDTGVMHLAVAHGTPCVILSGATHPVTIRAVPALQEILYHPEACEERDPPLDCRSQADCPSCQCIRSISLEEVLAACRRRLGLPGASAEES